MKIKLKNEERLQRILKNKQEQFEIERLAQLSKEKKEKEHKQKVEKQQKEENDLKAFLKEKHDSRIKAAQEYRESSLKQIERLAFAEYKF